jgi:hypothetical protein
VTSLMLDGEGRVPGEAGMNARGLSEAPHLLPVAAQALHLVCCCEDFGHEEDVEVRVLAAARGCCGMGCQSCRHE